MIENGFELREFSSIEECLNQDIKAKIWYFTRPQLERMGERILKKQAELRAAISFRKNFRQGGKGYKVFIIPYPAQRTSDNSNFFR